MRIAPFLPVLVLLAAGSAPGSAADLSGIDRAIAREPAYKSRPRYCLLVFGPEAKFRVWLVQDGDTLYVDRNGNGDLTEPGEKATWNSKTCEVGLVSSPDGKLRYRMTLKQYPRGMRLTVVAEDKQRFMVGDPDGEALVFADRPADAPVAHIGGPLAIELSHYESLVLRVRVGTTGLGKGSFAARVLPDVAAVAQIAFPSREPGGPPIVTRETLKDR
jgi:hypothetical protein